MPSAEVVYVRSNVQVIHILNSIKIFDYIIILTQFYDRVYDYYI